RPLQEIGALRHNSNDSYLCFLCCVTLFHGQNHPHKLERLSVYRITLPEAAADTAERWKLDIDLGVVARIYALGTFDHEAWLRSPAPGLGGHAPDTKGGSYLYAELAA